jgi:hypothetical protein
MMLLIFSDELFIHECSFLCVIVCQSAIKGILQKARRAKGNEALLSGSGMIFAG